MKGLWATTVNKIQLLSWRSGRPVKKVDAKADITVLMVQVRVSKGIVWAQRDTWLRLRGQKCFPEVITKLSSEEQVEIGQIKGPRKVVSCQDTILGQQPQSDFH